MTLRTNARLAGWAFLLYIATGIASMVLFGQAAKGEGAAAQLASIAQHETALRLTVVLTLLEFVYAVVLAVTLYALTRDQDRDLAMLGLCCRASEGVIGAVAGVRTLGLLPVAAAAAAAGPDASAAQAFGALLLKSDAGSTLVGSLCFALGSMAFAYLFLRARTIPLPLAWLGVGASILLLVGLPLQIAGLLHGTLTTLMWIPMAAFEVPLGLWLIGKGFAMPPPRRSA
jgi:hypothetical protein